MNGSTSAEKKLPIRRPPSTTKKNLLLMVRKTNLLLVSTKTYLVFVKRLDSENYVLSSTPHSVALDIPSESQVLITIYLFLEYRHKLFLRLEDMLTNGKKCIVKEDGTIPTLASQGEQVTRELVKERHSTRGIKRKEHVIEEQDEEVEGARRKKR